MNTSTFKLCGTCRHLFNAMNGKLLRGSYQDKKDTRFNPSNLKCKKCDPKYWFSVLNGNARKFDEQMRGIVDDEDYED